MNHRRLQRALVVALHDPEGWAAAAAAGELGLAAAEREALAAVDPRALRTDPLRRRRLLRTLAEEYKASTTLLCAATRSLVALEGFCGSRAFRAAVMGDASLPVAFGDYLRELAAGVTEPRQCADVVAIEATRTRCRRALGRAPAAGVGLAPGVALLEVDAAAMATLVAAERWQFELGLMPQAALTDEARRAPAWPAPAGTRERLLFSPAGGDVAMAPVDAELWRVLDALRTPAPRAAAMEAVSFAGVPRARAGELIESLVQEGLVAEGAG